MNFKTTQEAFWAGKFGDEYISRNNSDALQYSKVAMWSTMLRSAHNINSALELGCNIGLNLIALNKLNPKLELAGYEINTQAALQAQQSEIATIFEGSILEQICTSKYDLTFTAGVLIHINPDFLDQVYQNLVSNSKRYILIAEYYNPVPTSVNYRDQTDKLFKRDFAGDLIDNYGLNLVDYGFLYRRDNWSPQDDITWFLLEK